MLQSRGKFVFQVPDGKLKCFNFAILASSLLLQCNLACFLQIEEWQACQSWKASDMVAIRGSISNYVMGLDLRTPLFSLMIILGVGNRLMLNAFWAFFCKGRQSSIQQENLMKLCGYRPPVGCLLQESIASDAEAAGWAHLCCSHCQSWPGQSCRPPTQGVKLADIESMSTSARTSKSQSLSGAYNFCL